LHCIYSLVEVSGMYGGRYNGKGCGMDVSDVGWARMVTRQRCIVFRDKLEASIHMNYYITAQWLVSVILRMNALPILALEKPRSPGWDQRTQFCKTSTRVFETAEKSP
jgi:hypothetical protein